MIGIKFEKVLRSLVLTMHKMSGYAKTFKVKGGYKDKNNKINYIYIYIYINQNENIGW